MSEQNGTVTWWELQVTDLEKAQAFYGATFGWSFQSLWENFVMVTGPDGAPIGGLDSGTGQGEPPAGRGVRIYVQVADLEATLEKVTGAGGTVTTPRTLITEENGWYATFTDPSGLTLGLLTTAAAA